MTKHEAEIAIELAAKWIGRGVGTMHSSAQLMLENAKASLSAENYKVARICAKRSLAYSVGIFHPDYQALV